MNQKIKDIAKRLGRKIVPKKVPIGEVYPFNQLKPLSSNYLTTDEPPEPVFIKKGEIYEAPAWDGLPTDNPEHKLSSIQEGKERDLNIELYAGHKNSAFILFMAEFNGWVQEEIHKDSWGTYSACATTISMNWPSTGSMMQIQDPNNFGPPLARPTKPKSVGIR